MKYCWFNLATGNIEAGPGVVGGWTGMGPYMTFTADETRARKKMDKKTKSVKLTRQGVRDLGNNGNRRAKWRMICCPTCDGRGWTVGIQDPFDYVERARPCPECKGSKRIWVQDSRR